MKKALILLAAVVLIVAALALVTPQPAEAQATNGCGPGALSLYVLIPDKIYYFHVWQWRTETFNFTPACNSHDLCYSSSGISRSTCDTNFYNAMLAVCNRGWTSTSRAWCRGWAWTYYQAVRNFGGPAYTP